MNVLQVSNLTKCYDTSTVVKGITFELEMGKCTALLGPNGAGKTTTLNMITGLLSSTSGSIQSPIHPNKDLRSLIGFLPQYPTFYDWMSGEEFMKLSGELCGLSKAETNERTESLLTLVGLEDGKKRRISQYSGGMKQRLGIAQALIQCPKLLILDEPVSALDPFGRREILELMKQLKSETTILFSTHILNDAEEVSDYVLFMNEGDIIEQGHLHEVKRKNAENILVLTFSEQAAEYVRLFKDVKGIDDIHVKHDKMEIFVKDAEKLKHPILQVILQENLPLTKFEMSHASLEDIFMKVVRK